MCSHFEILKSNYTANENEHLWHLKGGIILKFLNALITFTLEAQFTLSKHCYTGGIQRGFQSPYDSITSLQLPLKVTKRTVTQSQEPGLARGHVYYPFCPILTAKRGCYTQRVSVACPRHLISKGRSPDSSQVHLTSESVFSLSPTSGRLPISQM